MQDDGGRGLGRLPESRALGEDATAGVCFAARLPLPGFPPRLVLHRRPDVCRCWSPWKASCQMASCETIVELIVAWECSFLPVGLSVLQTENSWNIRRTAGKPPSSFAGKARLRVKMVYLFAAGFGGASGSVSCVQTRKVHLPKKYVRRRRASMESYCRAAETTWSEISFVWSCFRKSRW